MLTGPVGPVEDLFNWPEAVFGNFYWPGASDSLLAFSPDRVAGVPCQGVLVPAFNQECRSLDTLPADLAQQPRHNS